MAATEMTNLKLIIYRRLVKHLGSHVFNFSFQDFKLNLTYTCFWKSIQQTYVEVYQFREHSAESVLGEQMLGSSFSPWGSFSHQISHDLPTLKQFSDDFKKSHYIAVCPVIFLLRKWVSCYVHSKSPCWTSCSYSLLSINIVFRHILSNNICF